MCIRARYQVSLPSSWHPYLLKQRYLQQYKHRDTCLLYTSLTVVCTYAELDRALAAKPVGRVAYVIALVVGTYYSKSTDVSSNYYNRCV